MSRYDVVFIDLDGTLTDSSEGIFNAVRYALGKMNRPIPHEKILKQFIGPPLIYSFREFCALKGEEGLKALALYREYYPVKGLFENRVYPDVEKMLQMLKDGGKRIALASSKPENCAVPILEHFGLLKYFDFVGAATLDESRNNKPAVIRHTLKEMQIDDPGSVIMIGDRHYDIEGAKETGLGASMGVLYGYGSLEELQSAGAEYIAKTPVEAAEIILNL